MFQRISPDANEPRPLADELSAIHAEMITVPPPIGSALPSREPSAPAPATPISPAPSDTAKIAPTATSESPAWSWPIRLLTPQSEFWAMAQQTIAPASTEPERR